MTDMTDEAVISIANLARQSNTPFDHPQGGKAIVLPTGTLERLPPIDATLTHIKQSVDVLNAESFSEYVNRFKGDGIKTTIFADYRRPLVKAYIDYHEPGKPDYLHHAVTFSPPWSEQWNRWRGIDGKSLAQIDFAEFIEENIADIVTPDGAAFLDIITGLQAQKKVTFESGVRLQDGTNQITFHEDIEAKGRSAMVIPSEFSIGAPVFFGGEAYKVRCLLRYRIVDGRLTFAVKINRRLFIEQTAFADIAAVIAEKTALTVLSGNV